MVGSAVVRALEKRGYSNLLLRTHAELDLRNQDAVHDFFEEQRPEYVILCAARVGGIAANAAYPAEFFYDNIMIAANVIHAAYRTGVRKLINLGSSCIYPKSAPQPLKEEYLLMSALEPTNEAYALAKIGALKMCSYYHKQYGVSFFSAMPCNLYGLGDNYDLETSHVLPALIRKMHEAKVEGRPKVVLWGDGTPQRELLFADDLAEALVLLLERVEASDLPYGFLNIGSGEEVSIAGLASLVREAVAYEGAVVWDASQPNGTPRKLMDSSLIRSLGWEPKTDLVQGIRKAYRDFLDRQR